MKVFLHTIGCRLNHSEIETMARQLLAAGHEIVTDTAAADKVIINTCAVTAEAAKDARSLTRRIHRQNETADIILTGCYATIAPDELRPLNEAIQIVPNAEKSHIVPLLDPRARLELPIYEQEPVLREYLAGSMGAHTRAFIKVQDGCDNKCTFCVTTVARGDGQSRHLGDIVAEIQALTAVGYQEAVLTGVHLGSYGHDFGNAVGLKDLVQAILAHTDIPRVRLSSLEPWDLAPNFFMLWQNPRLLPHLHMPLQSGSDKILKRMARRTSRSSFKTLVDAAHGHIPDLNLSTDLIVGFPGETEADFAASMNFVETIAFSRLHVFSYSKRPGTAAANFPDQVAPQFKKERTRQMIALGKRLSLHFHQKYENQTLNVLWEQSVGADEKGVRWVGYSDNYIRVHGHGGVDLFNQITATEIHSASENGVQGRIVTQNNGMKNQ